MQSPGGFDIRNPPIQDGNRLPAGQDGRPMQNMNQLSKEEQDIIAECRSESYWYRALPLSVAFGSAASFMVRSGILSASQRFGAWPKTVFGAGVGYIVGKASYASACQEKFIARAPNSSMGRAIRKARGENVPDLEEDARPQIHSALQGGLFPDGKDTENTGGDSGYSDYFSSNASPGMDKNPDDRRLGAMTYDQLRAQHRQKEMEKPHMQQGALIKPSTPVDPTKVNTPPAAYSPQPPPPSPSIESGNIYSGLQSNSQSPYEFESPTPSKKRTNKYGDEGFE